MPIPFDEPAWRRGLELERDRTRQTYRDWKSSPYGVIARVDFPIGQRRPALLLGSAADCDAQLEGLLPRHLEVRVEGERFLLRTLDPGARFRLLQGGRVGPDDRSRRGLQPQPQDELQEGVAGPGDRVEVGRYRLRLSHQNAPAVLVHDPQSPALPGGLPPIWFPPDPAYRALARLEAPTEAGDATVSSTRGQVRKARHLGRFRFELLGRGLQLEALRLLEPGTSEGSVSVYFRDETTGRETYPVGRILGAEALGEGRFLLDFNRAGNFTCAFSPHFNCPIPPRENVLPLEIRAGERDPGNH